MTLSDLIDGLADLPEGPGGIDVLAISADSRQVLPGMVFAALAGTHTDGAEHAADAVTRGAVAVLASHDADLGGIDVPILRTGDPRHALSMMAARLHPGQPGTIAAVTGTAGKTSVASFLRQIWAHTGRAAAMIGTTGVVAPGRSDYGGLTTPDPVKLHELLHALERDGVTHCAMEASSHGLEQRRLDGVRLAVAGFTNLGRDHLDYHATMEDYFEAKMRLFDTLMQPGQPAVINADDEWSGRAPEIAKARGLNICSVGHRGTFLALKRVEQHRTEQIGEIELGGEIHRVRLPLAGEFQMANALVAAGMAIATGTDGAAALEALEHLEGAPGRLDLVGSTADGAVVYVDYAHKPDALEHVLKAVRPYTTGKVYLVFGCGGDRDAGKRPIMGAISARLADRVIVTDDNPRSEDAATIRAQIMSAAKDAKEIGDRAEAIQTAITALKTGDTLIIAGKGHEEGQIVGNVVHDFSDHTVARTALEDRS